MNRPTIVLFGEAERGEYRIPHQPHSIDQLADQLGNPPKESRGLYLAIQALLYCHNVFYFRVEDEGFSINDYMMGFDRLRNPNLPPIAAIGLPGVGDSEIIDASTRICLLHRSLLLFSESDLYDYLTEQGAESN